MESSSLPPSLMAMPNLPSFDGSTLEPIPLHEEEDQASSKHILDASSSLLSSLDTHKEEETNVLCMSAQNNSMNTPSILPSSSPHNNSKREFPFNDQDLEDQKPKVKRARVDTSSSSLGAQPVEICRVHRFRPCHAEQWDIKFEELLEFKVVKGHCCVPHKYEENMGLARWVKRQRYQYKLKLDGKPSTMTDRRVKALEEAGFVWDAHNAAWEERMVDLRQYLAEKGHCNVPTQYPANPQLATWVKCQRRQYKMFKAGKPSTITRGRYLSLNAIGFVWEVRGRRYSIRNKS